LSTAILYQRDRGSTHAVSPSQHNNYDKTLLYYARFARQFSRLIGCPERHVIWEGAGVPALIGARIDLQMPLPLPGSASCICTLLRPFVLRAQVGKTGTGPIDPIESTDPCKIDSRALLLGTHDLSKSRERVHYTASWNIPQAWDLVWEPVQHSAGVFCAVHPHSNSQHSCLSSVHTILQVDR